MQFLRGDFSGRSAPLRPPWTVNENHFTSICNRCNECIANCPAQIIEEGRGNFPVINFSSGECDFCGVCVDLCIPGALKKIDGKPAWSIIASIDAEKCLAYINVECRSCYDPCESRAIYMTNTIGGIAIPALNTDNCTGCGACFSVCPTQAINIQHSEKI